MIRKLHEGVLILHQNGAFDPFENNSDDTSHCFFVKIVLTISLKLIVLLIGGLQYE